MNSTTMNVHTVRRLTTRLVQINGQWHREIKAELFDDASFLLALYADDPACLALVEQPGNYMRMPHYDVEIERSDKPFGESPSAGTRPDYCVAAPSAKCASPDCLCLPSPKE